MKENESDYQVFRKWIGTWTVGEYATKKIEVMGFMKITPTRFNNLRGGKVIFTTDEKEKINELAGCLIFKLTQN